MSQDSNNLFRLEVLEHKKTQLYGKVFINTPCSYSIITYSCCLLIFILILFFIYAEITEKFIVSGYITSSEAAVLVYPQNNGIIVRSYLHNGDKVKKGDKLFTIDTRSISNKNWQEVYNHLLHNKASIVQKITNKKIYLKILHNLLLKKFISLAEYNTVQEEIFDLIHKKHLIEIELIRYKQNKFYYIYSTINGTISGLMYKQGQYVNLSKPLMKIIPDYSNLLVELFVPARHAGFLDLNATVMIHYDAYPYIRFGAYTATIQNISSGITSDLEEEKPIQIGEPYYKVIAKLTSPYIKIYGKQKKIQHGMLLTGSISGVKRKIWQWLLDPLYSYYGTN